MIIYSKLDLSRVEDFWALLNRLDTETDYMMYEPDERKEKRRFRNWHPILKPMSFRALIFCRWQKRMAKWSVTSGPREENSREIFTRPIL